MRRVFEYRAAWTLAAIVLGYWALAALTPYAERGTGLRGVFLVLSGWGMFAYWRPAWRALTTRGWPSGELLYAVMVFMFCASVNLNMAMVSVWRLSGQPAFMINNALFDFWIVLGICALTIGVTVPNLFGSGVPPRDKITLGTAWLVMFSVVFYLVLVQPDLRPLAEVLRPALERGYDYPDPEGGGPTLTKCG